MQLKAYLKSKNIELDLDIDRVLNTGKNEEFELFELGRRLYYLFTKQEPYSSYERFTNANPREKLEDIRKLCLHVDENLALMIEKIIGKENRALVFSELLPFIELDSES